MIILGYSCFSGLGSGSKAAIALCVLVGIVGLAAGGGFVVRQAKTQNKPILSILKLRGSPAPTLPVRSTSTAQDTSFDNIAYDGQVHWWTEFDNWCQRILWNPLLPLNHFLAHATLNFVSNVCPAVFIMSLLYGCTKYISKTFTGNITQGSTTVHCLCHEIKTV